MTLEAAKKLINLNKDFYDRIGKYWNNSPSYAWQGWDRLFSSYSPNYHSLIPQTSSAPAGRLLQGRKNVLRSQSNAGMGIKTLFQDTNLERLSVLDLGCGNGRFANFLCKQFPTVQVEYVGLDHSETLLKTAKQNLDVSKSELTYELVNADILLDSWPDLFLSGKFDLVVMFGLLHHVPGNNLRHKLFQQAAHCLAPQGQLVFTTWRFNYIDRLRKRIVDLNSAGGVEFLQNYDLNHKDFESGDYILNWVKKELAYRYSHDYDINQVQELLSKNNLSLIDRFLADGRTETQNEYFVTKLRV